MSIVISYVHRFFWEKRIFWWERCVFLREEVYIREGGGYLGREGFGEGGGGGLYTAFFGAPLYSSDRNMG